MTPKQKKFVMSP